MALNNYAPRPLYSETSLLAHQAEVLLTYPNGPTVVVHLDYMAKDIAHARRQYNAEACRSHGEGLSLYLVGIYPTGPAND